MKRIRRRLTGPISKQVIDPSDIVADALKIYKHPSFDDFMTKFLQSLLEGLTVLDLTSCLMAQLLDFSLCMMQELSFLAL